MNAPEHSHKAYADDDSSVLGEEFRSIFDYYAPRLRMFFIRRGAPVALSEELVQDVMLTVWKKAEQFDRDRASLGTWIFAIARNKHLDRLRRPRPEPHPSDPAWLGDRPEQVQPPEEAAAELEHYAQLRQAIDGLPEDLKTLLNQLYYEGRSMAEVADQSGLALGTVKSRARRALALLRNCVTEDRDT